MHNLKMKNKEVSSSVSDSGSYESSSDGEEGSSSIYSKSNDCDSCDIKDCPNGESSSSYESESEEEASQSEEYDSESEEEEKEAEPEGQVIVYRTKAQPKKKVEQSY